MMRMPEKAKVHFFISPSSSPTTSPPTTGKFIYPDGHCFNSGLLFYVPPSPLRIKSRSITISLHDLVSAATRPITFQLSEIIKAYHEKNFDFITEESWRFNDAFVMLMDQKSELLCLKVNDDLALSTVFFLNGLICAFSSEENKRDYIRAYNCFYNATRFFTLPALAREYRSLLADNAEEIISKLSFDMTIIDGLDKAINENIITLDFIRAFASSIDTNEILASYLYQDSRIKTLIQADIEHTLNPELKFDFRVSKYTECRLIKKWLDSKVDVRLENKDPHIEHGVKTLLNA